MEFDKSKVYTALNADELKEGSKVIVADTIEALKENVKAADSIHIDTLERIRDETCPSRFYDGEEPWNFAYLVEEPKEQEWLKWTDLKIGDVLRSPSMIDYMVTGINRRRDTKNCHIFVGETWLSDELLKYWEKVE